MRTSEVLNKAADNLERDGWRSCRGDGTGDDSPASTCAANALFHLRVEVGIRQMIEAQRALWTHLGGNEVTDIWLWNDAPERTKAEVIAAFRACAVIEAAREDQEAAELTYAETLAAVSS